MPKSAAHSPGRLAALALVLLGTGVGLALLWVPADADQGETQRIFYLHVPIALTAYACFGWGAWKALRLLWTRDERYDLESYTGIHMGLIFGTLDPRHRLDLGEGVLGRLVGLARAAARRLPRPVPLLLGLLHAALLARAGAGARAHLRRVRALRRRADPGQSSSLCASRTSSCTRSRVFTRDGPQTSPASMLFTFSRLPRGDGRAGGDALPQRAGREAARRAPARAARGAELSSGEKYLWAAYLVVLAGRARLGRDHRAQARAARAGAGRARGAGAAWLSCSSGRRSWPTARRPSPMSGQARRPRLGRAALWGVRIGWLAQTASARRPGDAHGRVPVVVLGGRAQPLRLARRHRLPRLGQPPALRAARAGRHARGSGAAGARVRGRRPRRPRRPSGRAARAARRSSCSARSPG